MSKVFLGVGHGGSDSGAVGYIVEKDGALVIATACKDYLIANGVEVRMSRYIDEDESLREKINECNAYNPDLCADIHLNAGGGDGAEVFHSVIGGKGKILAENILKELEAIGQNSRGTKTKVDTDGTDYFGFIRCTNAPAVITEAYFVDNATDVQIGDTVEEQKIVGQAIAKGFLRTLGISSNNDVPVNQSPAENGQNTAESPVESGQNATGKIATIQSTLNSRYGFNIAVDNIFGNETKTALVKALQTELNKQFNAGLAVDGIFGNLTKNACVVVEKGDEGNITYLIQAMLNCKGYDLEADSIFGSITDSKVKEFQKNNNLEVDGLVGKNTFESLFA